MNKQKFVSIFNPEWQLVATISFSPLCHCEESSTRQSHQASCANLDCHVTELLIESEPEGLPLRVERPRNDTREVLVVTNLIDHPYSQIISSVLERLKTENPKLNIPVKDEDGCVVDMLRVGPDDERYLDGVANDLKKPGLQAYVLGHELLDTLKRVNDSVAGLRAQVVPEVLDLDTEHALIALETII